MQLHAQIGLSIAQTCYMVQLVLCSVSQSICFKGRMQGYVHCFAAVQCCVNVGCSTHFTAQIIEWPASALSRLCSTNPVGLGDLLLSKRNGAQMLDAHHLEVTPFLCSMLAPWACQIDVACKKLNLGCLLQRYSALLCGAWMNTGRFLSLFIGH